MCFRSRRLNSLIYFDIDSIGTINHAVKRLLSHCSGAVRGKEGRRQNNEHTLYCYEHVSASAAAPHTAMSNISESINVYFQFDFSDTRTKA